jgi:hypothetical protein
MEEKPLHDLALRRSATSHASDKPWFLTAGRPLGVVRRAGSPLNKVIARGWLFPALRSP